jgi:hypothetical protein
MALWALYLLRDMSAHSAARLCRDCVGIGIQLIQLLSNGRARNTNCESASASLSYLHYSDQQSLRTFPEYVLAENDGGLAGKGGHFPSSTYLVVC